MRNLPFSFALASFSLVSALAHAQEAPTPPEFGTKGTVVLTGESTVALQSTQWSNRDESSFAVRFAPGFDYFVAKNVSLGFDVDASYMKVDSGTGVETTLKTYGFGARIGANVPMGPRFSFYPRFGLGIESSNVLSVDESTSPLPVVASSPVTVSGGHDTTLGASVFAPILYHPAPHAFVGLGPVLTQDLAHLSHDALVQPPLSTTAGMRLVVGGWWGGANDAPQTEVPAAPTLASSFGERGQVVFTGALGFSATARSAGVVRGGSSIVVAPSADYFVAERFSIGIGASIDHETLTDIAPSSDTYSIAPRIGGAFPLGERFTIWPSGSVGYATASVGSATSTSVFVGLSVPLLFHLAPHAFVGVSPYATQEVMHTFQGVEDHQHATALGASLLVGIWL